MIDKNTLLNLLDVKENFEVPDALTKAMMDPDERINLMDELSEGNDMHDDFLYDYFSTNQTDRKNLMQDYTPESIRKIVTGIIGKRKSILDVCAGIGGLTIDAMQNNPDSYFQCSELSKASIPFLLLNMAIRNVNCDIKEEDVLTQKVNKIYHLTKGEKYSNIKILDTEIVKNDFEAVISNPPYSLKFDKVDSYADDPRFKQYGLTPKAKSDYLFVLHCLHNISDDGVAALILPHGVLFRGQREETIRKKLAEENLIEAIIGLPEKMFLNTGIPAIIMILKKKRNEQGIYFINADKEFEKDGKQNYLSDEQIQHILNNYKSKKNEDKFSRFVAIEEIQENNFNLNIPRYVDTSESKPVPHLDEVIKEIVEIENQIDDTQLELLKMMKQLEYTGYDKQKGEEFKKRVAEWEQHCKRRSPKKYEQLTFDKVD